MSQGPWGTAREDAGTGGKLEGGLVLPVRGSEEEEMGLSVHGTSGEGAQGESETRRNEGHSLFVPSSCSPLCSLHSFSPLAGKEEALGLWQ